MSVLLGLAVYAFAVGDKSYLDLLPEEAPSSSLSFPFLPEVDNFLNQLVFLAFAMALDQLVVVA